VGGEGMQFEWNQWNDLSLARFRRMIQKTVAKFFSTKEKVITDSLLKHLGTFSILLKVAYTYVTNQIVY